MPKYRSASTPDIDAVFAALADPTRRAVVHRLGREPASVGELAQHFTMSLPSFLQHIRVLEDSGLVRTRKRGRVRSCELRTERLNLLEHWLDEQRRLWRERGDRLAALAETEANAEARLPELVKEIS